MGRRVQVVCGHILDRRGDAVFLFRVNVDFLNRSLVVSRHLFAGSHVVMFVFKKTESEVRKPLDSPNPLDDVTCLLRTARQACRSAKRQKASLAHHRRPPRAEDLPPMEGCLLHADQDLQEQHQRSLRRS